MRTTFADHKFMNRRKDLYASEIKQTEQDEEMLCRTQIMQNVSRAEGREGGGEWRSVPKGREASCILLRILYMDIIHVVCCIYVYVTLYMLHVAYMYMLHYTCIIHVVCCIYVYVTFYMYYTYILHYSN